MTIQTTKNLKSISKQPILEKEKLQVVIGLGHSGMAAVNYLVNQGYQVAVTDANEYPSLVTNLPPQVQIQKFGAIDRELLLAADRIIISPGVSLADPAVVQAIKSDISVVSDIQLFHQALAKRTPKVPILAITGSNAKSTVTTLVGQMAKDQGVNVSVGGNIGIPSLSLLANKEMELAVLELSSFQLETVTNLNAQVATILNISPDHLDRHGDMEGYQQAKQRIFQGAKTVVVNRDDQATNPDDIELLESNSLSFGVNSTEQVSDDRVSNVQCANEQGNYGLLTDDDGQVYLAKGTKKLINSNELNIKGQHNQLNILAGLALGELVGLSLKQMLVTCCEFAGLDHRCQFITNINGVDYFNDSKGTNIGSTLAAIKGLGESYSATDSEAKIALILGGQAKGQDFTEMVTLINQFVSHLYFIGEDAQLIEQKLKSANLATDIECSQVATLDNAVMQASQLKSSQYDKKNANLHAVLLSPACASFDQFSSYTQRGNRFIELVSKLMI